ncbi:TetR/AcrR family transcriptional regulator [Candidatus Frankia alpina]|uniref:TetR/AcrR family transcriptional regulator n=1 Tax=Candidatus Frankia alpina TaxID=2699483 RepID=UPI001F4772DA|nr:TetR/AcrR family transcriptional regulator [Candidatus Frankia alpina]
MVGPERALILPSRRRDPYPVSPVIGPEGERACAEIVAAARALFARRGYHGTSISAIAEATGRSDTAFYQYFPSKIALFAIFYEQLGQDLVRHFHRQRVLEPGPAGLAEFRAWLDGLDEVLCRHSPVFATWPLVADEELEPEDPSEQYLHVLAEAMRPRLALAGTGPVDTRVIAIASISLMQWTHVVFDPRRPDVLTSEASVHARLATIIHSSLFPRDGGPTGVAGAGPPWPDLLLEWSTDRTDPLGAWRETVPLGLRRRVTRRSEPTIRRILAAARQAFERGGLVGTSVDDITAEAGVAHGTFYQYWEDRYAIFATLAHQAAVDLCAHLDDLLRAERATDVLTLDRLLAGRPATARPHLPRVDDRGSADRRAAAAEPPAAVLPRRGHRAAAGAVGAATFAGPVGGRHRAVGSARRVSLPCLAAPSGARPRRRPSLARAPARRWPARRTHAVARRWVATLSGGDRHQGDAAGVRPPRRRPYRT